MFHSISKLRNKDDEANHGSSFPVFQAPARNCDMVGGGQVRSTFLMNLRCFPFL